MNENYKINMDYQKHIYNSYEEKNFSIKDVLKKFTSEQLIDAIGEKETEKILRTRKLKKIENS